MRMDIRTMVESDGDGETLKAPPTCSRCNKHIYDGTILRVGSHFWHNACLRCDVCHKSPTEYCHIKGTEVYCRNDFIRLFGVKCVACMKVILPSEAAKVTNGNAYHPTCLSCNVCKNVVETGDMFYMREDGQTVCMQDYTDHLRKDEQNTNEHESDESESDETGRRHRTYFRDDQLRMLNDAYERNKRPGRKLREQFSKMTGLSCKVIQTWFQNRRAKERQERLKQRTEKLDDPVCSIQRSNMASSCHKDWSLPEQLGQTTNNNLPSAPPADHAQSASYQLYCPLDYLSADSMPPNVELSAADLCNGEVITGKHFAGSNKTRHVVPEVFNNSRYWLAT